MPLRLHNFCGNVQFGNFLSFPSCAALVGFFLSSDIRSLLFFSGYMKAWVLFHS